MKLIAILVNLALERYFDVGSHLKRFSWFGKYIKFIHGLYNKGSIWSGYGGVALATLPLALVVWLIVWIFAGVGMGVVTLIINIAVLLYCMGPDDLHQQITALVKANDENEPAKVDEIMKDVLGGDVPSEAAEKHRALSLAMFSQINGRLFSVLLWFFFLGSFGAVFYRTTSLLKKHAEDPTSEVHTVLGAATTVLNVLDWIPARIASLAYALAGNFVAFFKVWLKLAPQGLKTNDELLKKCGLFSIGIEDDSQASVGIEENKQALMIVDRALIIYIVFIAVFTLGALIY